MMHDPATGYSTRCALGSLFRRAGAQLILLSLSLTVATAQLQTTKSTQPSTEGSQNNGITTGQAAAILKELRQIRELLEKQQAHWAPGLAPQPVAPAPSEKVQMNVESGWHVIGNPNAPVTLVEFADYQCPFCKRFNGEAFGELKKHYIDTGKVRFVSRDMPLDFHPYALKAAEAARCAGDQQKYWELRDAMMANATEWSDQFISTEADKLSLDMKEFQTCMRSEKYKAEVQKDGEEAARLQINGTPTFVLARSASSTLNGSRIVGAQPFAAFQAAIDALLSQ